MEILNVTDAEFKTYGRVLEGYDMTELLKAMEHAPLPLDEVIYEPSIEELEALKIADEMKERAYGGLEIQIGYCNGNNKKLNAVEYHRSSELDIAVDDLILLLGCQQDIKDDYTYDTEKIKAFLIPAGTGVELYATTLHYAPCSVTENGFRCVVVLPEDTNTELTEVQKKTIEEAKKAEGKMPEDGLLTAKNKWLIAHEEAEIEGAFNGLCGVNVTV